MCRGGAPNRSPPFRLWPIVVFQFFLASMGRLLGFGYVMGFTLIVIFTGAAAMFTFESEVGETDGFSSYGDAMWWTAMMLTTIGSDY